MSQPLSSLSPAAVNAKSPLSPAIRQEPAAETLVPTLTPRKQRTTCEDTTVLDHAPSSPFVTEIGPQDIVADRPGSPIKEPEGSQNFMIYVDAEDKDTTVYEGGQLSPTKDTTSTLTRPSEQQPSDGSTSLNRAAAELDREEEPHNSLGRDEEPESTVLEERTAPIEESILVNDDATMDETNLSMFSEIPNADMTAFGTIASGPMESPKRTPLGQAIFEAHGANFRIPVTPSSLARKMLKVQERQSNPPSPTPTRPHSPRKGYDTVNLLDFTSQFEALSCQASTSPSRRPRLSPAKSQTQPDLRTYLHEKRMPSPDKAHGASPSKRHALLHLLDFDLPPPATPRSVPTITVRELEIMKSSYLSEISSLKANLSGKEAEVESLKKAINDAERRVGDALEKEREERSNRECVELEKTEWETRARDLEARLNGVREDVMNSAKERDDLAGKLEKSSRRTEELSRKNDVLEARALEAETELAALSLSASAGEVRPSFQGTEEIAKLTAHWEDKLRNMSQELHGLYEAKHKTKIATLKKSYEQKARSACADLQEHVEQLRARNAELEACSSRGSQAADVEQVQRLKAQSTAIQEQRARVTGLEGEIAILQETNSRLQADIERERIEKGELVAAVDEMLALQAEPSLVEDFRKSMAKPSAMRGPGFGLGAGSAESRIGRVGAPVLGRSVSGGKSRILTNIERMGGGRSVD